MGVFDLYRGEMVKVYIVLKNGVRCIEEELNEFFRKYLVVYKVLCFYEFWNEFFKIVVGKILWWVLIDEENEKYKKVM